MSELEPILKYNMDPIEAKAFKLGLLWEELCAKEFPGERHAKLKKNSDPRKKSNLFNHCYKLARETKGIIPDEDYKLYIRAQLQILKMQRDGQVHALIDPQILVGDKAWNRWQLWKRHYDRKMREVKAAEDMKLVEQEQRIVATLATTHRFLESQKVNSYEAVKAKLDDLSMIRWLTNGKITPYYAIMSPWVQKWLDGRTIEDVFKFDLSLHRPAVTPSLQAKFKQEFSGEYCDSE